MNDVAKYAMKIRDKVSKRGQVVIDAIIKDGSVTTDYLKNMGYDHPPRAIRDVREAGIPLVTKMVKDTTSGRRYGIYTFGDPEKIEAYKLEGRKTFPKSFKITLLKKQGNRCAICNEVYDDKYLQIDHRVPYQYSGDSPTLDVKDYMLLCAECNRKKDRATEVGCQHTCFKTNDISIIRSCFWASPEDYTHICLKPIRHTELTWYGEDDLNTYTLVQEEANRKNISIQDYIKNTIKETFE